MKSSSRSSSPRLRRRTFAVSIVVAASIAVLAMVALAFLPPGDVQASGHWVTGMLTNNSVEDMSPQLSSTHVVWAQMNPSDGITNTWATKLCTISTGAIKTIDPLWPSPAPLPSIAGDYVVIGRSESFTWRLYQISTGSCRTFSAEVDTSSAPVTDGTYVVYQMNDGDFEIVAYDIPANTHFRVTNNTVSDFLGGISHGRIVYDSRDSGSHQTIMAYDLATRGGVVVHEGVTSPAAKGVPQIGERGVGFFDPTEKDLSIRLAGGWNVHEDLATGATSNWRLTDDYAFWVQDRPLSRDPMDDDPSGTDLYALDLRTHQKTQLTFDDAIEYVGAADGAKVVYVALTTGGKMNLMVVDLDETPVQPHQLAQDIKFGPESLLVGLERSIDVFGNYVVASLFDGHDTEICWAGWVEDSTGGAGGDTGDDDGDGGDGGSDGGDGSDGGPGDGGSDGVTFPDVAGSPYETAIYDLAERGIIAGREDGTFGPSDTVSRQQFAKMIVKALGFTVTGTEVCPFGDVAGQIGTDPFYPAKYVAVCAARGITTGYQPRPPSTPPARSPISSSSPWWHGLPVYPIPRAATPPASPRGSSPFPSTTRTLAKPPMPDS